MSTNGLASLLHRTFGFTQFRENQEAVCAAAVEGRDVLLVMPTGAGKSLCYQLPAIARGGTALVISPLIALMDDQSQKLADLGLRVGRIHSGLDRETARQVCRDYLDGSLQFLFIAPERLRVPGFAAMLAKRQLSLIAIDEAHCISQWGHDFRPDYRTLGQHLPALRPAPLMALTATATPEVQCDIVTQLGLQNPVQFIHGFKRTNLSVEVVEVSKPERHAKAASLLADASRRPAIVYAPSRKDAESLAGELHALFPTAAYHAGMEPAARERVQRAFLSGKLEVVVATVAFGMGIDKADVRTVIHTAAPSSVESFYQEIGRAGRDGLPSRSVLMYSFLDRKTHEFFLDRDYPPLDLLAKLERALQREGNIHADDLRMKLKMSMDEFAPAMDRLVAQGAATLDFSGNVQATDADGWRRNYEMQLNFRRSQIDRMMCFAGSTTCRMAALVRHFGDSARDCGHCDICAPEQAISQNFRAPSEEEERELGRILRALTDRGMSTGKLKEAVAPHADRREFDVLLDALCRAGYVTIEDAEFRGADGNDIRYRKVLPTHEGRTWDGEPLEGVLLSADGAKPKSTAKTSSAKKPRASKADDTPLNAVDQQIADRLRTWRAGVAKELNQPAFCVFTDRVLKEIARQRPESHEDLKSISGFGSVKIDRWGDAICDVVRHKTAASGKPVAAPILSIIQKVEPQQPDDLGRAIKIWRMHQAKALDVAPFSLLSEDAVTRIAAALPSNPDDLSQIDGVNSTFVKQHGDDLCTLISQHIAASISGWTHPIAD
ncbi:MAG: RecQ family ATP-dependent DNA helicase [Acidobacteria bacterium]|nr:RecQ family ATP-dependent DNA helicase [Acidobacteriota bacterium]